MKQFLFILSFILIYSCNIKTIQTENKEAKPNVNINTNLYDIWLLKKINSEDIKSSKQLIFEINTKELSFMGNANCNNFSGKLKSKNSSISFYDILSTQSACEEINEESKYLALLEKAYSFQIKNMHLLLFDKNERLLLEFRKID